MAHVHVGFGGARVFVVAGGGRRLVGVTVARRLIVGIGAGEQRVLFQLGLDKGLKLDVRQLQQFDRLLQLRRYDQTLALSKL